MENKTINFHGNVNGENLQIGDHNQITVTQHITEIQRAIEKSNGTPEQKEEAKGVLQRLSENPDLNAPFVFVGPDGYAFPSDAEKKFRDTFKQYWNDLYASKK